MNGLSLVVSASRISSAVPTHVGAEQLAVGQDVVDQGRGVDDQVDGVGQPLPGLLIQPEVGFALVAGDDLQMLGGQFAGNAASSAGSPLSKVLSSRLGPPRRPWRAPGRSACRRRGASRSSHSRARKRPRNPVAPVNRTVRTSALGGGSAGAAASVVASRNLSSVRSRACTSVASRPCTAANVGRFAPGCRCVVDVVGDALQVGGRADDDTHRHVDVEDLLQQIGKRQRRQRVSAQVVEVRIGTQVAARRAQQRGGGPADGLQHRPVGAVAAQLAQVVGLALGQLGVQLFQSIAVVLLELGARQLADTGQQAVLSGERRGLDDEVARDLIGLQARFLRDVLQRLADQRLELVEPAQRDSASWVGTTTASR